MFDPNAKLDTSEVNDQRGGGGGGGFGGGGFGTGGGIAVGGGAGTIILLILSLVLGFNPLSAINSGNGSGAVATQAPGSAQGSGNLAQNCQTGADANNSTDCRVVGTVDSVQKYWTDEFTRRGMRYQLASDDALHRPDADGVRRGDYRRRPVLLPERQGRLH